MQFLYGQDHAVTSFVAQVMERDVRSFGRFKAIGVLDDEQRLIGGAVYYNYDPQASVIEGAIAAIDKRFFNREAFRRMLEYVFITAGCQMLFARVRSDNEHLLAQLARLNFSFTLIPRMYGRGEDGVIATLTDDQWLDSKLARRVYRDVKKEAA